jgi:glycosyltransferase involved in cell wall biosynthesis
MKIAFFSKFPIFPTHGGNRSRMKTLCDEFIDQGCDIYFVLLPSRDQGDIDSAAHETYFGKDRFVELVRRPIGSLPFLAATLARRELGRLRHSEVLNNNIDYRYDSSLSSPIRELLAHIQPDMVLVNYVHYSKILELAPSGATKVLDTHDSFAHEFTATAEGRGLERADLVIAIQDSEAARFDQLMGTGDIQVISHIAPPLDPVSVDTCIGATFVGSRFDANDVSLQWLTGTVLPLVLAADPTFKLVVAGTVGGAIDDHPSIIKLGRVEQLADAYRQAPVLANAIQKGTGVKIKLLEAQAMGIPAVSTQLGVAGVSAEFLNGVAIVQDDDPQRFADRLIAMRHDAALRRITSDHAIRSSRSWNEAQRASLRSVIRDMSALPHHTATISAAQR